MSKRAVRTFKKCVLPQPHRTIKEHVGPPQGLTELNANRVTYEISCKNVCSKMYIYNFSKQNYVNIDLKLKNRVPILHKGKRKMLFKLKVG